MSNRNTIRGAICTLLVVWALTSTARADSTLNFVLPGETGIAVTNTTPYVADVKFTFYAADGSVPTAGLMNNISRRIPPGGQIALLSREIFRMKPETSAQGWIQATSSVTGLQGYYFAGDYVHTFDGAEAAVPQSVQVIPFIPAETVARTTLYVANPGTQTANNVTVTFYDDAGRVLSPVFSGPLAAHSQTAIPGRGASARIEGDAGVLAVAVEEASDSLVLINGQPLDTQNPMRIAPQFRNRDFTSSVLVLTNPSPGPVTATVSFFNASGGARYIRQVQLPANGSRTLDWFFLQQQLFVTGDDGWLRVDSAAPLTGVVMVVTGTSRTAIPLQSTPSDRVLLSAVADTSDMSSQLTLVGDAENEARVTLTLTRRDGRTAAKNEVVVRALSKVTGSLREFLPGAVGFSEGFLTISSTAPLWTAELLDERGGASRAAVTPQRASAAFAPPAPLVDEPSIRISSSGELRPGASIIIETTNVDPDATLFINGQVVPMSRSSLFGNRSDDRFSAVLPQLEPGFVSIRVLSGGLDSNVVEVGVTPGDGRLTEILAGTALFQKVEVTDSGLDTARTSMVPIRGARVEIVDRITQTVVSVADTDEDGAFSAAVPGDRPLTVRVVSKLRYQDLKVLDNTDANKLYILSKDIDSLEPLELIDTERRAGAFNILDAIQRGNAFVTTTDPAAQLPPVTIYWSQRNTNRIGNVRDGLIGTTYFNLATNSAYILGDRATDSDEFDDSVVLHEYAHMLAAKFSHDDSPGGLHILGDLLDPRVAWSEGFANFFSCAVRGNAVFRDSKGPTAPAVRFDIEENVPPRDRPGYRSESSVHSLLWDLVDENADQGDAAQFPFAAVWNAFTAMRDDRFVYLPFFLEHFLSANPGFSDALRTMVVLRNIDFQPDVRPSVTNPFPSIIAVGEARSGEVDSLTTQRTNLAQSSHFFSFNTTGGQALITLAVDGPGPANNPNANDLDLFLYDSTGKRIDQSDGGYNGQWERIAPQSRLAAGNYYVEIRSFYTRKETNSIVYNSGHYRLTVEVR